MDETPRGSDDVDHDRSYEGYKELRYGDNIASDEQGEYSTEMRRYVREEEQLHA